MRQVLYAHDAVQRWGEGEVTQRRSRINRKMLVTNGGLVSNIWPAEACELCLYRGICLVCGSRYVGVNLWDKQQLKLPKPADTPCLAASRFEHSPIHDVFYYKRVG